MKKLTLFILFTILVGVTYAQRGRERYDPEKLKAAKIAFITTRLDLQPEQAEKFWPVYNNYSDERDKMLHEMIGLHKRSEEDLSEEEAKRRILKRFAIQEQLLKSEMQFVEKVSKVLSYNQIFMLNGLSRDFARHIYQRERKER
ncbi:hypothetical protein [Algoriphagus machipongonensis]|uniref:Sensor of ECF-type sigma factor n=1 Tax=Algoriphagus machipongonensis TaxID=388413 RepID=A3I342_9BACT|nr:hypothetical protein [Algoriphagus machipongonensis]EAZ79241.1 hypothetical protein ALPR1_14259 [Algoriphagus machipongonensis]